MPEITMEEGESKKWYYKAIMKDGRKYNSDPVSDAEKETFVKLLLEFIENNENQLSNRGWLTNHYDDMRWVIRVGEISQIVIKPYVKRGPKK